MTWDFTKQSSTEKKRERLRPNYKANDSRCQNRGRCNYCYGNRTYGRRKMQAAMMAVVADAEAEGLLISS